uniref:DAG1 domain-containing protein n=1 Tax=Panagrellus redivivus TaxID=6233 RepID=A0A7E4VZW1_PANRE
MDRQGNVMLGMSRITMLKTIAFNADEAFELILKKVPDQSTKVKLLNADRYVPMESMETTTPKKSSSATTRVVVIVLLAIAGKALIGHFMTLKVLRFNDDGTLNVFLARVPSPLTVVTLLNAERYVPPEQLTEPATPKKPNTATIGVVVIALLVISGLLFAGLIVLMCYCRRRTPQQMEHSDDQGQKHKTLKDDRAPAPLPSKPKSGRTSSTTVTTATLPVKSSSTVAVFPVENVLPRSSMIKAKPTLSPHANPIPSASPFDNTSLNNSTNESASYKKASDRHSKSTLRRPSSQR